ncbi:MAG TPA: ANTAR domain-containing protein [Candidatus Limnocylindrales bacterium]|nr:ANTAR domain-containing protein [Candidatus Limnocylindrales bacterium]
MGKHKFDFCIGTADTALKRTLITMLTKAGFFSAGTGKNIPEFLRALRAVQPWLAVVDTAIPPGNIGQLANIIEEDGLAAALYIDTGGKKLDSYFQLAWPVEASVLTAVAEALCKDFAHKKKLHDKINDLQKILRDRKEIEKAKRLVMQGFLLTEEEAYCFLQKCSMTHRTTMIEITRRIIADPDCISSLMQHR